jgi:hypothetical protein
MRAPVQKWPSLLPRAAGQQDSTSIGSWRGPRAARRLGDARARQPL